MSPSAEYREQLRAELESGRLVRLGVISAQFALVVAAIRLTHIESGAFELVLTVALGGFLVHHFLPTQWRLGFFALLSVASVPMVLGLEHAAWLLVTGGLLIASCHLPIALWMRVALVILAAVALAADRNGTPLGVSPLVPTTIWPILGAMFMFRLIVYLYDLKHQTVPFGAARALAYFFMLPNVCFPLFPVVDYKTLQRSHYNDDALRLYQTGVNWMLRGLLHLALYKFIYFKGVIEPSDALDGIDAGRYMLTTYLLYLKISGSFHLIVGLLHMYGFGLAETHHLYLFSSGFTDFWRRINIYWKDFIQKLVFNPVYFALRKLGEGWALGIATLIAFSATWFLHSYQWFWIQGEFPVVWSDLVFWFGLGVVVLVNVLLESRHGRRRSLEIRSRRLGEVSVQALKIGATFASICLLWTLWSTPKLEELALIWRALLNSGPLDLAVLVGVPLGLGVIGALLGRRRREVFGVGPRKRTAATVFWPQAATISTIASAVIFIALRPTAIAAISPEIASLVGRIRDGYLNAADLKKLQRGYYEDLGDVTRFNSELWKFYGMRPRDWGRSPQTRYRPDAIAFAYIPSTAGVSNGALHTINSHGLRDREYELERDANTFRIALVGASHDAGVGVEDDDTYENVVEDRLNRELGPRVGKKFEILNFSHGGYGPTQKVAVVEQRVFAFQPDVVLYVANDQEFEWTFSRVGHLARYDLLDQFPYIRTALDRAGIAAEHGKPLPPKTILESKLEPFAEDTLRAVLGEFREETTARGILPGLVLLEIPDDSPSREKVFDRLVEVGRRAGLPVLDLQGSFAKVENRKSLWIFPWDSHTNAEGHRLLADRLYRLLLKEGLVPTVDAKAGENGRPGRP